jgi:hypothetical protein
MKKNTFALFIISYLAIIQCQCFTKPYEPQVKGGYKSCTATEYRYKSGKIVNKSGEKINTVIIDDKGSPIESIYYENNKISQKNKSINKYDSKNLLIETVIFDGTGKPMYKIAFAYDEQTNMIGDTTYKLTDGDVWQRGSYKYDKNNFLIEETHEVRIDSNEFSKGTTYYKNDKNGNKIEESAIRSLDISANVSSEVNLNNKDNQSKSETSVQSNSNYSTVKYEYKYDKNNNIIKQTRIGIDDFKLVKEYKYDNFGNIIEEFYPSDDSDKDKNSMRRVYEYSK